MSEITPTPPPNEPSGPQSASQKPAETSQAKTAGSELPESKNPSLPAPKIQYAAVQQSLKSYFDRIQDREQIDLEDLITIVQEDLQNYLLELRTKASPHEMDGVREARKEEQKAEKEMQKVLYSLIAVFLKRFAEEQEKTDKSAALEKFSQFWGGSSGITKLAANWKNDPSKALLFSAIQPILEKFDDRMAAIHSHLTESDHKNIISNLANESMYRLEDLA